jgi:hypothetical protein
MGTTRVSRDRLASPPIARTTAAQSSAWRSSSCAIRSATAVASSVAFASTSCAASCENTVVDVYSFTIRSSQSPRARATDPGSYAPASNT